MNHSPRPPDEVPLHKRVEQLESQNKLLMKAVAELCDAADKNSAYTMTLARQILLLRMKNEPSTTT